MSGQKIGPGNLKGGTGGVAKDISPFLGVAGGDKQISDPLWDRNLFFVPDSSGVILPGNAGVKISIFAGVDEGRPPKVGRNFLKILVNYLERSPQKTGTP